MTLRHPDTLHLMLIDSDKHIRESLKVFFDDSHTDFLVFKSAREGLNALKYQRADVVICDYFLPDMDGVAFLEAVACLHPLAKRILMATLASDELEDQIQRAGIDRFIEKPLTVACLDQIISGLKNKSAPATDFKPSGDKNG